MAKGNIGNLLQHFLALRAAECLIHSLDQPCVNYVDAFSMDAWESVEASPNNAAFQRVIRRFGELAERGDFVAKTFLEVWRDHYYPDAVPPDPRQRDYPNSAVLLQAAFPGVEWRMRLHEIDKPKRQRLTEWAASLPAGVCQVAGDWRDSPLIVGTAVRPEEAALVMLDPFKVVAEGVAEKGRVGLLPENQLRYMLGRHCLDLDIARWTPQSPPAVVVICSYADSQPDAVDRIIRRVLTGWYIDRVRVGPLRVHKNDAFHQGWCAVSRSGILPPDGCLQQEWNEWSAGTT